jgi:hypothetical protein
MDLLPGHGRVTGQFFRVAIDAGTRHRVVCGVFIEHQHRHQPPHLMWELRLAQWLKTSPVYPARQLDDDVLVETGGRSAGVEDVDGEHLLFVVEQRVYGVKRQLELVDAAPPAPGVRFRVR